MDEAGARKEKSGRGTGIMLGILSGRRRVVRSSLTVG